MRRFCLCLILGFLVLVQPVHSAPPTTFDLISDQSVLSLGIHNFNELRKKGEEFLKESEWNIGMKPTELFDHLFAWFGIGGIVDRDRGAVFMIAPTRTDNGIFGFLSQIVVALPIEKSETLKKEYQIPQDKFKPKTIISLPIPANSGRYLYFDDKVAYLGQNETSIREIVKGKPLVDQLKPEQKKAFQQSDVFLAINLPLIPETERKNFHEEMEKWFQSHNDPLADPELNQQLSHLVRSIKTALVSFRVDPGLGLRIGVNFDEDEKTIAVLKRLGAGAKACDLQGLPEGNLVFAQAAQGDGEQTAPFARKAIHEFIRSTNEGQSLLGHADRAIYIGVFTEIWKHLKGTRIGVYQNSDLGKQGVYSATAIVDTENSERFLGELKKFARIGEGGLKLGNDANPDDRAEVEKLIKDLSHPRFKVRETALNKLCFIGEAALPYLDKAIKEGEVDLSDRAKKIREEIARTAELRRKEPLSQESISSLRPSFVFDQKPEVKEGVTIETLHLRLAKSDPTVVKSLQKTFGPQWNQIRIVSHEKQVVVVFGSNEELVRSTLTHLKEKKSGLAKSKFTEAFNRYCNPDRKIEIHFSLERIAAIVTGNDIREPEKLKGATVSSIGMTVGKGQMQFDIWFPTREFKEFIKPQGW